jgi:hypothetical protein
MAALVGIGALIAFATLLGVQVTAAPASNDASRESPSK